MASWFKSKSDKSSSGGQKSTSSTPGRTTSQRQSDWAKKGSKMLDNERLSEMDRLIGKWQGYKKVGNTGKTSNFGDKIRGLGSNIEGLDVDSLLNSLWGGSYDAGDYAWGQPTDGGSIVNEDVRPVPDFSESEYAGYGPGDVPMERPGWMSKPKNKYQALDNALMAEWNQQQMQAINRQQAQDLLGEGMEDIDTRLVDEAPMSPEVIDQILAGYDADLALGQNAAFRGIDADLAARGLSATGDARDQMRNMARFQRSGNRARIGSDLRRDAAMTNRDALERALQFREGTRSNIANIGTGYGATPYTMPSPAGVDAMRNPPQRQRDPITGALMGASAGSAFGPWGAGIGGGLGALTSLWG